MIENKSWSVDVKTPSSYADVCLGRSLFIFAKLWNSLRTIWFLFGHLNQKSIWKCFFQSSISFIPLEGHIESIFDKKFMSGCGSNQMPIVKLLDQKLFQPFQSWITIRMTFFVFQFSKLNQIVFVSHILWPYKISLYATPKNFYWKFVFQPNIYFSISSELILILFICLSRFDFSINSNPNSFVHLGVCDTWSLESTPIHICTSLTFVFQVRDKVLEQIEEKINKLWGNTHFMRLHP